MVIKCNNYKQKEIMRFMRDCTGKTQTEFAKSINRTRSWSAKAERDEIKISLNDFLELARIHKIDIIMEQKKD